MSSCWQGLFAPSVGRPDTVEDFKNISASHHAVNRHRARKHISGITDEGEEVYSADEDNVEWNPTPLHDEFHDPHGTINLYSRYQVDGPSRYPPGTFSFCEDVQLHLPSGFRTREEFNTVVNRIPGCADDTVIGSALLQVVGMKDKNGNYPLIVMNVYVLNDEECKFLYYHQGTQAVYGEQAKFGTPNWCATERIQKFHCSKQSVEAYKEDYTGRSLQELLKHMGQYEEAARHLSLELESARVYLRQVRAPAHSRSVVPPPAYLNHSTSKHF